MAVTGQVKNSYLAVTTGLHEAVEITGQEIVRDLGREPRIPGIALIRHMNYAATREGVRFLDSGELGGKFTRQIYDADPATLDRDELAAWEFMHTTDYDEDWPSIWLGIDPHDSPAQNANSLVLSHNFTSTQLAVAGVMELENVVMLPNYPFLEYYYPYFVSVETTRDPVRNRLSQPRYWRKYIKHMVELGPDGMNDLGKEIYGDLRYWQKLELLRVGDDGEPEPHEIERISKLEDSPTPGPYFTYFERSHPLFKFYPGLRDLCGRIAVGYWDDNHHTNPNPELYGFRKDGRPRSAAFGALLLNVPLSEFQIEVSENSRV